MTREEAIKFAKYAQTMTQTPNLKEFYQICERTLRAQQAPAKLDRSRWDGCDWCKSIEKQSESFEIGDMMAIRGATYTYYGDGEMQSAKERFCPICGRPLTEEAWAELERRNSP